MIHYTPLPLEVVFENWDQPGKRAREITVNGITLEVEPLNEHEAKIVRLVSSNPEHFLNPSLAPGQVISFVPFVKNPSFRHV